MKIRKYQNPSSPLVKIDGAVDKFLEDFYGYTRPEGKNVNGASPEVYNALVEAYRRKHPNPKQIWVDSNYPAKQDGSGSISSQFLEFLKGGNK